VEQNPLVSKEIVEGGTDRIQKKMLLRAPLSRVWRALTVAEEFGTWFCAKLTGKFVPGAAIRGPMTISGYEHLTMELTVERVEPERLMSFRWHPYAIDPSVDYASEPTTLVTFELSETAEGIALTVTETGFDKLPAGRRPLAFRMNDEGWGIQMNNVARYLTKE